MKQHELKPGEDVCIHCHGTSNTPIECVDRPEPKHQREDGQDVGGTITTLCSCPFCLRYEDIAKRNPIIKRNN
jgi:hypothetical protein